MLRSLHEKLRGGEDHKPEHFSIELDFFNGPVAGVLLVFIVIVSQWQVLISPFISLADGPHSLTNPGIRNWSNLADLFSSSYLKVFWEGSYHPLPTLTYFVEYAIFGNDPLGYRVLETLFLSIIVMLIWRLGRRYMGQWAWVAAVLYATSSFSSEIAEHRLNTTDEMMTMFCLLSVASNRYFKIRNYDWKIACLTAVLYILALLSKETAVILPALLLLDDTAGSPPKTNDMTRWIVGYIALMLAMFAYGAFLLVIIYHDTLAPNIGYSLSSSVELVLGRFNYFLNLLWGVESGNFPVWAIPMLVLVTVMILARDMKAAIVLAMWTLISLLPYSGILPLKRLSDFLSYLQRADRYLLLSGVGWAWLIGAALYRSVGSRRWVFGVLTVAAVAPFQKYPLYFLAILTVFLAGLVLFWQFGKRAWIQCALALTLAVLILFKASEASPFIRWNVSDLKCVPKAISSGRDNGCNFSMSAFLSESPLRRRYPKTYEEYESVIRSDKTGTLADLQNYFSGALEDSCRSPYVARLLFTSNNSNVILWNLIKNDPIRAFKKGCLALRNGSPDATSDFVEAIKEDPLNAHAYRQLAFSYWRSGNRKEALRNHQRHAVVPASFYTNSCHCSTDEQRLDEAIKLVLVKSEEEKAVALSKGKSAEALAKINAAIQMNPVDPDLVLLSGSLKGELGDYNGALKDYNEAVELTDVESHWRESTFKNDASQNGSIQQLKDFRGVVLSHRAKAMLDQKKPELAAEDLREALRIASPGWHLKAEVEMKLRELEGSGKTEGGGKALEGQGR